jgi:hypothetical protein
MKAFEVIFKTSVKRLIAIHGILINVSVATVEVLTECA